MTDNRRIFWNVIASYGRSLYALVIGLLCGRWVLMSLGETDYGLNGLVGGLTVFITFFNGVLAGANARFYAFSIGAAKSAIDKVAALEECRRWFNTAFSVHTAVPFVLVIIGYPLGAYAIEHWLTIPADRTVDCVWVFRFVCISCFFSMLNVPFHAMYGAKQYIAELTIYGFVTSTLNVLFVHHMLTHPGVWLVKFAAWTCLLSIVPQILICVRACFVFPECRIQVRYMWDMSRLRRIAFFTGWQFLGAVCSLLRGNGMSIVINKFFGATMNAAQTIGNTVQGHCYTLANAMQNAFVPVITQACGAGDHAKMCRFALRTGKFNVLLSMIFVIPLALELHEVLRLWLVHPPVFSAGLCYCAMASHLVTCCTVGHVVAINATGRIALFHAVVCFVNVLTLPFAVVVGFVWHDVYLIMSAVVAMEIIHSVGRLYFGRLVARISVLEWLRQVLLPLVVAIAVSAAFGLLPRLFMSASGFRVCTTTFFCELAFMPLTWFVLFTQEERIFVREKFITKVVGRFRR